MVIFKKKNIYLFLIFFILSVYDKTSNAELSYNFSKKQLTNGKTKDQEETLRYYFDDDSNYYYNFDKDEDKKKDNKDNTIDSELIIKDNESKKQKIQPTGDKENEIKLKISGLTDVQYFYSNQKKQYKQDILPNGLPYSPAMMKNNYITGDKTNVINMLGKITINPEFNRYKTSDGINKINKERLITVGAKLSQPFFNASKNVDPRFAAEEYIYVKTKYLHFQIGSVNSAGSRMRVDAQRLASGNGGVFGTWWQYISLPVFNTNGLSNIDRAALNAMSPVYILYPTLPNEAGFTTQRTAIATHLFNKNDTTGNNLLYGSLSQGYPTQGAYSNKVSMYLPRIKGFSFGISYSPTTANTGLVTKEINKNDPVSQSISGGFVKHYTSIALDYKKQFDKYGLGVAFSFSYEYGKAEAIKYLYDTGDNRYDVLNLSDGKFYNRNDLNAFAVGAQIVYKNYSFAYSYGYWGKSLLIKDYQTTIGGYEVQHQVKNSYYHTAGIGANYGPIRVGLTYMRSSYSGYKLDAFSFGTDFKMISLKSLRVNPYFEIVGYLFHTPDIRLKNGDIIKYKAIENKGLVTTLGIRILF